MKSIVLIFIAVLMLGCDRDEDFSPDKGSKIFSVIVGESFNTSGSGDWLLVHDSSGKLVYSSRFETGDTLTVNSMVNASKKISITFFSTVAAPERKFNLQTYTDIMIGEQWVLENQSPKYFYTQPEGTFTLTALNIPPNSSIVESTRFGASGSFEAQPQVPYSFKGIFSRYPESPVLVFVRDSDNLRYKFFDNVVPNEDLSFSYPDLKIPETIIDVEVFGHNQIFLNVQGFESASDLKWWGYSVGDRYWENQQTSIKIGYIDRLTFYRTRLTLHHFHSKLVYEKIGSAATSIVFPENVKATFNNLSAVNFSADLSLDFQRRISQWSYQPQGSSDPTITWSVNSPSGKQNLNEIPKEIKGLFPTLTIERLTHSTTQFILSGSAYDDLIETTFKGKNPRTESEIYSAFFW